MIGNGRFMKWTLNGFMVKIDVRSTLAFRGELAHFPLSALAEIVWAPLASRSVGSPLPGGDCSARRLEPPASPPPSCPPQAPRAPEPSLGPAPGWVWWWRGYRLGSRGPAGAVASGHGCRSPTFVLFFSCSPSYGASCSFTPLKSQRFWDCAFSRRWLLLTPMRGRLSAPAPLFFFTATFNGFSLVPLVSVFSLGGSAAFLV